MTSLVLVSVDSQELGSCLFLEAEFVPRGLFGIIATSAFLTKADALGGSFDRSVTRSDNDVVDSSARLMAPVVAAVDRAMKGSF
ncbi:hypothetical protein AB0P28_05935 [Pseudarthrobacter sp. NPDC089323]